MPFRKTQEEPKTGKEKEKWDSEDEKGIQKKRCGTMPHR